MKYKDFVTAIQENKYSTQPQKLTRQEAEMVAEIQLKRAASNFDRFEIWQDLLDVREQISKKPSKMYRYQIFDSATNQLVSTHLTLRVASRIAKNKPLFIFDAYTKKTITKEEI